MKPRERDLTIDERFVWGDCPVCEAKDGESCHAEVGWQVGVKANGAPRQDREGPVAREGGTGLMSSRKPRLCRHCGLSADAPIHAGGHPERCHEFEIAPREWPILFRAPLVRANREGRETVTRRLSAKWAEAKPGELIVVREAWRADVAWDDRKPVDIGSRAAIWYEADGDGSVRPRAGKLRPSIFLPRWASRDVYPIVSVREEKLQDITSDEARAEGFSSDPVPAKINGKRGAVAFFDPLHWFTHTWEAINGKKAPWRSNPTVFRVEYSTAVTREPGR